MKNTRFLIVLLALLVSNTVLLAQSRRTITGLIKNEEGQPVPSATVTVKGTGQSAVTDESGQYSIAVDNDNAVLVFSSVGFIQQELRVGNAVTLNATLMASATDLDEVVVTTALGIERQKKSLGYATTTIKSDEIVKVAATNFATALYGKAPGVRIGATPGGGTSAVNITIRGLNSINGNTQPLIVLDGIPIRNGEANNSDYWNDQRLRGNGLLDINNEDIEDISILKGASAAALYGSEAVNGVILITTKKGKRKGFTVDLNTNYSTDQVAYLPRYQNVRGPGAPLHVSNGGQNADGFIYHDLDGNGTKETRGVLGYSINFGPKFDEQPTLAWDGVVRPYVAQEDNYKSLFQKAQNHSINIAVSQVSDNSNMRFSLTRQQNEGVSLGARNTKNVANFNSTFKLGKKFTTDIMVNYVNQHIHNRPYSIDRMINNFTGMMGRFEHGDWYLNKYQTSKGYRFVTGTNQSFTPKENIIYPGFKGDIADYVWRVYKHNEDEYSNRIIASLTNTWQVMKDLRLRTRVSTDFTSQRSESKQASEVPIIFNASGYFGMGSNLYSIFYGDALLTYSKRLSKDIEINVMGGYSATKEKGASLGRGTNGGLSTENFFDIAASVNTQSSGSSRIGIVKDAFMGTINGNYKDYLFLEATVRRDRTSTMHPKQNSFVYPSFNTSYVLSEAVTLPSFVNYAKLRGSWGIVGNYPQPYQANIAYDQNTLGVQAVGTAPIIYTTLSSNFGNDGIRPERKHEFEFGLEAKFLNNRIGIDISYYNAQVRDQILPLTLPASTGATSILTNIGTLRNKGIEVLVIGYPVRSKSFTWEANINFAKNRNVVEKLATGSSELLHADYDGNAAQLISKVGEPMGDFYAHPVARNDKGEMIVESNGLYQLAPNLVKIGNAMPKAVGGFTNSFIYKSFNLDILFDYRFGGYVMPTGINWMVSRGLLEESLKYMDKESGGLSYYVENGKGVQTTAATGPNGETVFHDGMLMQGVTANGQVNTNVISQALYYWQTYGWGGPQYSYSRYELYIKKNSYIKCREISIGYSLPATTAKKLGAKRINLSVFGRNLFYAYRTLKNMDAEQTTAGSRWAQTLTNAGTNPSTRSFGVMLRASF